MFLLDNGGKCHWIESSPPALAGSLGLDAHAARHLKKMYFPKLNQTSELLIRKSNLILRKRNNSPWETIQVHS